MMMRRISAKVVCLLLCMVFALCFTACDASYSVLPNVVKTDGSFYGLWDAVGDMEHDIGKEDGDGWAAGVNDADPGILLSKSGIELKAGAYNLAVLAMEDNNTLDNNTVFNLRVLDAETGDMLASKAVKRKEFAATDTYEEISFNFAAYSETTVDIQVHWTDLSYIKINRVRLQSVSPTNLPDKGMRGRNMLSADKTENIVYDENTLYYFDFITYAQTLDDTVSQYDLANLLMTLQGLVNRDKPHIFVNYTTDNGYSRSTDKFWLEALRRDGEFLAEKALVEVKYPMTLLKLFQNSFSGFVLWDENVPATVNVAATMSGVEDLLPLRADSSKGSLAQFLTQYEFDSEKRVEHLENKFGQGERNIPDTNIRSTGSAKNDAYLWAKAKYLDTGLTNDRLMAYHLDAYSNEQGSVYYADLQNRYLANRDYYVANKAFFFDLNPWPATLPDDDPTQEIGTDYNTLREILYRQNQNAGDNTITIGGFVPWDSKYTATTDPNLPGVVDSEWQSITVFSEFNCIVDADAYAFTNMANASVYMHFPKKESYVNKAKQYNEQNKIAESAVLENKNYILFYMGDYDSSAWLNTQSIATYLTDPCRGEIPLMWPIAANNYARAPHAIDYLYRYQTNNDYFVYVNNGLGYFNPLMLKKEGRDPSLNGTLDSYFAEVAKAGEMFDLDLQGLVITATPLDKDLYRRYAQTAPAGIITNWATGVTGIDTDDGVVGTIHEVDALGGTIQTDAWTIRAQMKSVANGANFIVIRTTLRTASYITELYEYVRDTFPTYNLEAVDPYTFFKLYNEANAQ